MLKALAWRLQVTVSARGVISRPHLRIPLQRLAVLTVQAVLLCLSALLLSAQAYSEPQPRRLRIAVFHADLSRAGPGLLLRDMLARAPPVDIMRAAQIIAEAKPDVLLLQGFDYDAGQVALTEFNRLIGTGAAAFEHVFSARPNTGWPSGVDLDGDGRSHAPRDAHGYGRFAGEGGMAVLSRLPLGPVIDLSGLLWKDLPGADLPKSADGTAFPSEAAWEVLRLSTTAHWDVPVEIAPGSFLHLLAFHATPPAFDGPEDRNGRRARDEHRLWQAYLDGALPRGPPEGPFVLLGTGNLDPSQGEGSAFMRAYLADRRWQDPAPLQGQPTAFWPPPLGPLRVSYLLPGANLRVLDAGILPGAEAEYRSNAVAPALSSSEPRSESQRAKEKAAAPLVRHLVWVDLALEPALIAPPEER